MAGNLEAGCDILEMYSSVNSPGSVHMVEEPRKILHADDIAERMNVQMVRLAAREGRLPAYRLPGGRKFYFFQDNAVHRLGL